jgi:hypothetical protein
VKAVKHEFWKYKHIMVVIEFLLILLSNFSEIQAFVSLAFDISCGDAFFRFLIFSDEKFGLGYFDKDTLGDVFVPIQHVFFYLQFLFSSFFILLPKGRLLVGSMYNFYYSALGGPQTPVIILGPDGAPSASGPDWRKVLAVVLAVVTFGSVGYVAYRYVVHKKLGETLPEAVAPEPLFDLPLDQPNRTLKGRSIRIGKPRFLPEEILVDKDDLEAIYSAEDMVNKDFDFFNVDPKSLRDIEDQCTLKKPSFVTDPNWDAETFIFQQDQIGKSSRGMNGLFGMSLRKWEKQEVKLILDPEASVPRTSRQMQVERDARIMFNRYLVKNFNSLSVEERVFRAQYAYSRKAASYSRGGFMGGPMSPSFSSRRFKR